MNRRFSHRGMPAEVQDRLRLAAAVAAEQVLEEHVQSALELAEKAGDRAPVERLLAVYVRLHHLQEDQARKLRDRVLSTLGTLSRSAGDSPTVADSHGFLARLSRRLRGRVHQELRDWVERHTARVELALLEIHVQNALQTLRIVDTHAPNGKAISIYCEMLGLRSAVAEMVRLKVLKRLHDSESTQVELLRPARSRLFPLRVENDR